MGLVSLKAIKKKLLLINIISIRLSIWINHPVKMDEFGM